MKEKIILAYSGGLDTTVILKWLIEEGYEVVCYVANVGQNEDFIKVKDNAIKIGASKVYIEDLRKELVEKYIFKALKANAVYEGKYLLGTAIARPLIAKKQVEIALKENTNLLSHGATGKGNDQVRFELAYLSLMPNAKIISPWKEKSFLDKFKGRIDLINYAKENDLPIEATLEKPYSIDENIMHTSYESGILEDPNYEANEEMYKQTISPMNSPDKETKISIEFKEGIPIKVENLSDDKNIVGSLDIFNYLNKIGAENGIGRIDLVENRFIGMKSRGVYETPAGTILLKAHLDIEGLVLDKEVTYLKDSLMPKISKLIYNGFWFTPEFEILMSAIDKSQENVDGIVYLTLYKGNTIVTNRESMKSLYNEDVVSMNKFGGYDQKDAKGFIKLINNETLAKELQNK